MKENADRPRPVHFCTGSFYLWEKGGENLAQQNYIQQLNRFHLWLETNYLPPYAQLLWFKMIGLFNRCGWAEWVQVDPRRLILMLGAESKQTAYRARDTLADAGLLEYQKGRKGSPTRYKMHWFLSDFCTENVTDHVTNRVTNDVTNDVTDRVTNTVHINKRKQKEKENKNETIIHTERMIDVSPMLQRVWHGFCEAHAKRGEPLSEAAQQSILNNLEAQCAGDAIGQCSLLTSAILYPEEEEKLRA